MEDNDALQKTDFNGLPLSYAWSVHFYTSWLKSFSYNKASVYYDTFDK